MNNVIDTAPRATPAIPANPPSPPPAPRQAGILRRWRARLVVLVMLVAAVVGGIRVAELRAEDAALLDIGTVTLTANPVPVEPARPGRVVKVAVQAQRFVKADQELGRISTITTTGSGRTVETTAVLRAPVAGIISSEPAPVGTILEAGEALLYMYDPARLTFVANVPLAKLPEVTPGMTATLHGAGLPRPIRATVKRVVPRVGDAGSDVRPDHVAVELTPIDRDYVAGLVPGLRFTGTVDTRTRPPGAKQSVFVR